MRGVSVAVGQGEGEAHTVGVGLGERVGRALEAEAVAVGERLAQALTEGEREAEGLAEGVTPSPPAPPLPGVPDTLAVAVSVPAGALAVSVALEQALAVARPVVERLMLGEGLTERVRVVVRV